MNGFQIAQWVLAFRSENDTLSINVDHQDGTPVTDTEVDVTENKAACYLLTSQGTEDTYQK